MIESKIEKLVVKLNNKTRQGLLPWEDAIEEGAYQAALSDFTVQISEEKRLNEDGDIRCIYLINIFNRLGKLVEEAYSFEVSQEMRETMTELYKNARRSATSAEKAIDTLMSELDDLR
ncbi:MAG: hypothetical protein HQK57_09625 [Deltaproteobacteria bacterium]|nr:hypothetical protein [Deltaproteobacteria bacterium]